MENQRTKNPKAALILSILFVLTLLAFGVGIFLHQRTLSETENRVLATFPDPNAEDILSGKWQSEFEKFTCDQFPFRDALTAVGASVRYALGMRELGGALAGRTDQGEIRLFETLPNDEERDERLAATLAALEEFAAYMGGTETVFLPIPSSGLIYGEDLPPFADTDPVKRLYDTLAASAENYTVLSVLPALVEGRDSDGGALYFRTDHHWTPRGAAIAYTALCEKLGLSPNRSGFETVSTDFYGTLYSKALLPFIGPDTVERSSLDCASVRVYAGGGYGGVDALAEIALYQDERLSAKDQYEYFLGGNYGLVVIENSALPDDAPTLFVFKDSFANAMVPYLASSFRRVVMVDPRYYRGIGSDLRELLDSQSPSAVLVLYEIMTLADDSSLCSLLEKVA